MASKFTRHENEEIYQKLLDKIQDCDLDEIVDKLISQEISLDEFTQDFCEEFPTLYLNIIYNFRTFDIFKHWINLEIKKHKGQSLRVKGQRNGIRIYRA